MSGAPLVREIAARSRADLIRPHSGQAALLVVLVALLMPRPALAGPVRPWLEVTLRVRLAMCRPEARPRAKRRPVVERAWVRAHLEAANAVLRPHRVRLRAQVDTFAPARCDLHTRAHRHGAAAHVVMDHRPTVLVLRRVRDLDVRRYFLMGVHWRFRGNDPALAGRRYLLLTTRAEPPVLAHELCHFFGLPHDPRGGNLMTPGPSSPAWNRPEAKRPAPFQPRLTQRQAERLRRAIAAYLRASTATDSGEKAQTSEQRRAPREGEVFCSPILVGRSTWGEHTLIRLVG